MPVLFLSDFDGTLSPIVSHAAQAAYAPGVKKLVRKLCQTQGVTFGFISGRGVKDLIQRAGRHLGKSLKNHVFFAGNHGSEIRWGNRSFLAPGLSPYRKNLKKTTQMLRGVLRSYPGSWLENKEWSISVHYRLTPHRLFNSFEKKIKQLLKPYRNRLILRPGKKVWEIRPRINWDKGAAAQWIYRRMKNKPYPIYVGDDVTDEDVFRVFRRHGLTVRVGKNPHSRAEFFIRDQRAIKTFLKNIQKVIDNAG